MKTISIKVSSDNKSDNSSTAVIVERRQGDTWRRISGQDIVTNKDVDAKTFDLRPGDRVVVEAYPQAADDVVYDREQSASIRASAQQGLGADKPGTTETSPPRGTLQTRTGASFSHSTPQPNPPVARPTPPGTPPVQNPEAAKAADGSDTTKPVGQATPRPTGPGPDKGPELTQEKK